MLIRENVPLAPLTTLGVGGPARFFVEVASSQDVRRAVHHAAERRLSLFVLGGGSNLVISDSGWPGMVLRVLLTGVEEREQAGKVILEAGAGEEWDALVARAVARDCAGVECLSGIPGSVGGTPVQNVGAYGQEVAETIESVQALDLRDGQLRELCNPACGFAYRTSVFNTSERGRYIILRVTFALTPAGRPRLEYADLKKYFAGRGAPPSLPEVRAAVRHIRAGKAMLIVPGDEDCRSAGSFFKNPVLTPLQHQELVQRAAALGLQVPSYPALSAQHKVSAAWLVEHSGLSKGYTRGPVAISRKHALAIVNRGGATAADVVALKNEIQQRVTDTFGIQLSPEPVFVGFDHKP
jgi:UDP-N-acetylmuramate dehydrogenase